MTEAFLLKLMEFALKFGLDSAIAIATARKNASIDDAIAALETAKTKTAQDYLGEATKVTPT